ncbi:MAG: hypothetical protein AB8B72_09995 [Crocinitomicaceae bacterium]
MKYFIDGDLKLPEQLSSINNTFHSSAYCSTNDSFIRHELPQAILSKASYTAFNEVVNFYNFRETIFKKIEKSIGLNLWFFEQFRLYFEYRSFYLRIESIKHFIASESDCHVFTNNPNLSQFISLNESQITFIQSTEKSAVNMKKIFSELTFMVKQIKWKHKVKSNHILLSRIEDNVNGIDKRFGEIQNDCDLLMNRDIFNSQKERPKNISDYKSTTNVDSIVLKSMFSIHSVLAIVKFNKAVKKLFTELASVDSTSSEKTIFSLFRKNKLSYFIYFIKYRAYCRFFRKYKYSSVLMINENSAQQKAVQYAAKKNDVRILALQHGAINDIHPSYMFGKYRTSPILPDITFTWGSYFTNLLTTKGGYSKNQVVTAGRVLAKNVVRKKHKILNSKKKIIIYGTQPQPNKSLHKQELFDVLKACKALQNKYQLVIRPHPAEKNDSLISEIAESLNFRNFTVDRISDLQTHFESCSILITSYSTIGAEFVQYFKPLVVLDYLKTDPVDYIKQNICIPAYNGNELINVLKNDNLAVDKESVNQFLDKYFYARGIKAVDIIRSQLQN